MRYAIFNNGSQINTIEASKEFVQLYCDGAGYTYEEAPLPESNAPQEKTVSELEQLRADVDYIAMETGVEL